MIEGALLIVMLIKNFIKEVPMKRTLQILTYITICSFIIVLAALIVSCGEHVHEFGDWKVITEPTCAENGEESRACTCGETERREIAATGNHAFGEWETTKEATCVETGEETKKCECGKTESRTVEKNADNHDFEEWKTTTPSTCDTNGEESRTCGCGLTETRVIEAGHRYDEYGACIMCGVGSKFSFIENIDGGYTITGLKGDVTDTDIIIPSTYMGKAVTMIYPHAFEYNTNITSISIPGSITYIDKYVFLYCSALESVTIEDGVKQIRKGAFSNCEELKNITLPDSIVYIDFEAFYGYRNLEKIIIGNQLEWILSDTFTAASIDELVVPVSVTYVQSRAFMQCGIRKLYYCGNENDWENIEIESGNNSFVDAPRYYYSETEPSAEGNYWHYVDGVPTVW